MGLSTTDLGTGGNGLPKTISPGNHVLKINMIDLEDFKFIDGAKHLILHVETEPIAGFEGFALDKDNPEKGHYDGQIGRVTWFLRAAFDSRRTNCTHRSYRRGTPPSSLNGRAEIRASSLLYCTLSPVV